LGVRLAEASLCVCFNPQHGRDRRPRIAVGRATRTASVSSASAVTERANTSTILRSSPFLFSDRSCHVQKLSRSVESVQATGHGVDDDQPIIGLKNRHFDELSRLVVAEESILIGSEGSAEDRL